MYGRLWFREKDVGEKHMYVRRVHKQSGRPLSGYVHFITLISFYNDLSLFDGSSQLS